MGSGLVLHMASPTHYANLMMRYMVAQKLSSYVSELRISNVDLPYWGIVLPVINANEGELVCAIVAEQHMPFTQVQYLYNSGGLTRLDWYGYGQRLENFPTKQICRGLFRSGDDVGVALPEDTLLCPIRAGEILDARHLGYTLVPIAFYEEIIEETKLHPVFMGQLAENVFTSALRKRFPRATYLPHRSAIDDFQTIRKASNIVVPISTFAWLASWLSSARTIHMPLFGIFNPKVFGLHNLVPCTEANYKFYQFPDQPAVPLAEVEQAHSIIKGKWREVKGRTLLPKSL